jgi:hypothetical protein
MVRRAFNIAWDYKSLWIFGLFAGGGSTINTNWTGKVNVPDASPDFAYEWFDRMGLPTNMVPPEWGVYSVIILWLMALGLLFFICYLIAQPAIIDAVNKITRGGQYAWGTSFSRGADFFWRFLGLVMVQIFSALALVAGVALLAIVLTPFSLIFTIPLALVVFFFIYHTFTLAEVAMVARDNAIADAVIEGWNLLMQNKANCFLMSLIMVGIGFCFVIVLGVAAAVLYFPINLLVLALTDNLVGILMLAIVIGLPVALVMGGYTGTFFNALYVQFYFRLVEPQPATLPRTAPMI